MALVLADRVRDTTTTTGTGTITLSGTAPTGYQNFSVVGNGNTTYYTINADSQWEVGIGTYSSTGPTLSRGTVLASSNGGALVDFAAGIKDVFITYPAEKAVTDAYGTALAATTATNIAGGAAGSIPYQTAANTTSLLAAGTGVLVGGSTPSYTMSPSLTQVTVAADPTAALQVATKQYVDTIAASGVTYHTPVKYEVPSPLTATYNNGSSGVGATLTNAGTLAAFAPDGPVASVGDRILVYTQTNAAQNGIYTVTTVGSGSVAWVLTRATDADTYALKSPNGLGEGDAFFVMSGNTGAGETYVMNTVGTITFGTTAINFVQVSDAAIYSAGTGLTLTGTVFSLTSPVATTLGGTGLTSFTSGGAVYATSSSALTTGTLPATAGGTGQSSYTTGDLLYATSGTALGGLADVATGNALLSGGVGAAPSWGKVGLTTHVTGTLPVANGGSGATSLTGYLVGNGTSAFTATTTIPTSALSGTISLTTQVSGTLGAGNGGTGISSYTVGDIVYASATTTLSTLADVATGNALISGGVSNPPSWGKIGLTTHVSGTLPVSNGGTGATTLTGYVKGNGTSAFTASATIPAGDITGAALTKADDTNVTLTLGGSPSTALLAATSITAGWTGQLAVSRGGTGNSTLTSNYLLKGNGVSPVAASIIYDNGTNVGVNTASPAGRLSIASSSSAGTSITGWSGAYSVFGPNAGSTTGAALGLGYNTTTDTAEIVSIAPNVAWKNMLLTAVTTDINTISGRVQTNQSFRAPIFYDSDNTSYYLDAAGNSVFSNVQNGVNYTSGGGGGRLVVGPGSPYSLRQEFGTDNTGWRYGIAKNASGTVTDLFYVQDGGQVWALNDFRAPIFYDSNNTAYYLDAAGNSVFSAFNIGGGEVYFYGSATNAVSIRTGGGGAYRYFTFDASGNFYALNGSVYGDTFYDQANTAYYANPAGTSNFVGLTVANTITGSVSGGSGYANYVVGTNLGKTGSQGFFTTTSWTAADWANLAIGGGGMTVYNTPGQPTANYGFFIKIGNRDAGGPGWGGIWMDYSGGSLWYGNTTVSSSFATWYQTVAYGVNPGAGNVYAAIYYDANNTSYYVDPASGSVLGGNISILGARNLTLSTTSGYVGIQGDGGGWSIGTLLYGSSGTYRGGFGGLGSGNSLSYYWIGTDYNTASLYVYPGSYTQSDYSLRAPIFYDSNNTAYYVDPNNTSNLNALNVASGGVLGSVIIFDNMNQSHGTYTDANNVGDFGFRYLQGSTNGPGISGASQYYGMTLGLGAEYSYSQYASQFYWPRTPLGGAPYISVRFREGGGWGSWSKIYAGWADAPSGSTFAATGDFRAPIFYDSNDTGYYVDPASTSNIYRFQGSWATTNQNSDWAVAFRNTPPASYTWNGDISSGGPAGTWWFYESMRHSNGANYWGTQIAWGWEDNANRLMQRNITANSFSGWVEYLNTSDRTYNGNLYMTGSIRSTASDMRAPIFYDQNNTAYYVDPSSDTVLAGNLFISQANNASYLYMGDTDNGQRVLHNNGDRIGFLTQAGGWGSWCEDDGSWRNDSYMQTPIIYDINNTGYYLDPASGSYLNAATFAGLITGRSSGSTDVNSANDTGSISIRGSTTTVAVMSFHRTGAYAINMGLGVDAVFRIGGWSASSNCFQMDGSGNLTMLGNVTAYSDARMKKDVETIDGALALVSKMRGVRYTRIDNEERGTGVIAQEMLEVMPEVVQQGIGDDDTLSVAYGNLVGVLIEAVKELTARVAELEGK